MAINEETLKNLAAQVAKYADGQRAAGRSKPRIIVPERLRDPNSLSEAERAAKLRMVQFVVDRYTIPWVIDQVAQGRALETLTDEEVLRIYNKAGKALKCVQDNVSFIDAGLVEWDD